MAGADAAHAEEAARAATVEQGEVAKRRVGPVESPPIGNQGVLTPEEIMANPGRAQAITSQVAGWERDWVDQQIPALRGMTPREAAADPARRADLIKLLATFPEDGSPVRMDAGRIRAALGLV